MSERKWKLGDDCFPEDAVLDPVTFNDIILAVCNCPEKTKEAVLITAREILSQQEEDFWFLVKNNIQEIIDTATPEEAKPLVNAPGWDSARVETLAWDIQKWLAAHDMWMDVCLYYNGKRMSTRGEVDGKTVSRSNGEPFVEEGIDPRDYFEYVADPHILSLSFEGTLNHILNGYIPGWVKLEDEFRSIFRRHGCYMQMGAHWNATCYEL